jgi:hypothetical protein
MEDENQEVLSNDVIEEQINYITWENVRDYRDQLLLAAESNYNFDSPEHMKTLWMDYKQELRDIPTVYKDLQDLRLIQWPTLPTGHLQELQLSRLAPNS